MTRHPARRPAWFRGATLPWLALALLLLLAGCLGGQPVAADGAAPPGDRVPAVVAVGTTRTGAAPLVDRSCRVDADCVVKDVGSCCGVRPACVNRAATVDAEAVAAACRASGRMSTCGFEVVAGCSCNEGRCRARRDVIGQWLAEPASAQATFPGNAS